MKTFTFKAEANMTFTQAFNISMNACNDNSGEFRIEAFTAFKEEGLWVITINYLEK